MKAFLWLIASVTLCGGQTSALEATCGARMGKFHDCLHEELGKNRDEVEKMMEGMQAAMVEHKTAVKKCFDDNKCKFYEAFEHADKEDYKGYAEKAKKCLGAIMEKHGDANEVKTLMRTCVEEKLDLQTGSLPEFKEVPEMKEFKGVKGAMMMMHMKGKGKGKEKCRRLHKLPSKEEMKRMKYETMVLQVMMQKDTDCEVNDCLGCLKALPFVGCKNPVEKAETLFNKQMHACDVKLGCYTASGLDQKDDDGKDCTEAAKKIKYTTCKCAWDNRKKIEKAIKKIINDPPAECDGIKSDLESRLAKFKNAVKGHGLNFNFNLGNRKDLFKMASSHMEDVMCHFCEESVDMCFMYHTDMNGH